MYQFFAENDDCAVIRYVGWEVRASAHRVQAIAPWSAEWQPVTVNNIAASRPQFRIPFLLE